MQGINDFLFNPFAATVQILTHEGDVTSSVCSISHRHSL